MRFWRRDICFVHSGINFGQSTIAKIHLCQFIYILQLSLWQGDLTLQNLRLRKDSFINVWPDAFLLIDEGIIGEIQLKV